MKHCTKCGLLKPLAEFSRAKLGRDGRAAECKSCHRARANLKNRPLERSQAKQSGLSRYFTGRPCSRGHIAERYASGDCVECSKLYRDLYPENSKVKHWRRRLWGIENTDNLRAYRKRTTPRSNALINARRAGPACPEWADLDAIEAFYKACPKGMIVDHIVPLPTTENAKYRRDKYAMTVEGDPVSGLHVVWNLQYLPRPVNSRKASRMRLEDHFKIGY